MARIQLRSFAGQNIRLLFFPRGKESESEEFAYRKGQIFRGAYDSEKHWIVAISETASSDGARLENIIGYCLWIAPPTPGQVKSDEEKAREAGSVELQTREYGQGVQRQDRDGAGETSRAANGSEPCGLLE